jgi:streptogramin lyase
VFLGAACGLDLTGNLAAGPSTGPDGAVTDGAASDASSSDGGTDAPACDPADADLATSNKHCGSPCHDCLGGACEAGTCRPVEISAPEPEAQGLAIDATNIYWTNTNTVGRVSTCPLAGCNGAPTVLATGQAAPNAVIAIGEDVFWTNYSGSTLMRCARTGCNQTPAVHTTMSPLTAGFGRLATDGALLFFTDGGNGKVHSCPLGACAGTHATLASFQQNPWGIAVDETSIYWVNDALTGSVEKCPKSGCGANNALRVTLAPNQNQARTLAIDETYVYWTATAGGTVARCAKTGCNGVANVLVSALQSPHGIAVDATHVYFTERGTVNAIKRVPKSGGTVEVFADAQAAPFNVVVDQKAVYWTNWVSPNGAIMKRAK